MNERQLPPLLRLVLCLRPRWPLIALALLLALLNQGAGLALAAASALLVGAIVTGTAPALTGPVLGITGLAVLKALFSWLDQWYLHWVAIGVVATLWAEAYLALEPLAPAFTLRRRSGDLVATMLADVDQIQPFYSRVLVPATVAALLSFVVLGVLLVVAPVLVLVLLPVLLVLVIVPLHRWRAGLPLAQRVREQQGLVTAHLLDSIQGLRELTAFGRAQARGEEVAAKSRGLAAAQIHHQRYGGVTAAMTDAVIAGGSFAVALVGLLLVAQGALAPRYLPLVLLLVFTALRAVAEVADVARNVTQVAAAAQRYFAVIDEPVLVQERTSVSPGPLLPTIEFDRVTFRYAPEQPPVLRAVSFQVAPGETVALVGHSGAGKSTCVNLLLRFWDPEEGSIRLGGVDLRNFPLDDLRRRIAVVPQEPYLFRLTVRENLRLGRPEASESEVEQAAREANIHDVILSLPAGYDTVVGERGITLSGGERQRIAIARALLLDAPVLVLDEATSNLDSENERLVGEAITRLMVGRTTLVIAHRLATIQRADRVVLLEQGQVVASGRHEELLATTPAYQRLVRQQLAAARRLA
ncbi:MAG: thiol reductant ABC exporter subunit CydC [Chloroflexi bacterium]|nr:thiol reductant ABC exporter subunit CydC [Chloroflexota bacterium]